MSKLDLRFAETEEIKYRQSLEHHFLFPVSLGAVTIGCVCIWLTLGVWDALEDIRDDALIVAMVGTRFIGVISSFMLLSICILKSQTRFLRSLSLEFVTVAWVLVHVIMLCWFNAWHGPQLFGKDPHQIFPEWNMVSVESNVLITLCTMTPATCLVAPVRVHVSWLVPGCGMMSFFSATFIFGSPAESWLLLNSLCFIVLVICSLYGSYKNEMYQRQQFLAQRKVDTQQDQLEKQYDGVCRILNIVCDCLIRIGSDCHILEPGARFAAILMHNGRQSLEGTSFYDYISDIAGKERFKLMVTGMQTQTSRAGILETVSTAGMFHIHLRDACGKSFPVDIYHTQVMHDANVEYLVGIVEKSEPSEREVVPARSESQVMHALAAEPNVVGFMRNCIQGMEVEVSDESISRDSGSPDSECTSTSNEIAVEFFADAMAGCPVISCTPGFTSLSGPMMEMEPLMPFIEDQEALVDCTQHMLNMFYHECHRDIVGMVFAKPNGPIRYLVDCVSMDIISCRAETKHSQDLNPGANIVIRAVFKGIQQHRQRRQRRSPRRCRSLQTRASPSDVSAVIPQADGHDARFASI